jgi:hypothetical protein
MDKREMMKNTNIFKNKKKCFRRVKNLHHSDFFDIVKKSPSFLGSPQQLSNNCFV